MKKEMVLVAIRWALPFLQAIAKRRVPLVAYNESHSLTIDNPTRLPYGYAAVASTSKPGWGDDRAIA